MTVYVTSDDERALVEITPDDRNELPIGRYVLYRAGCTINVNVVKNGGFVSLNNNDNNNNNNSNKFICETLIKIVIKQLFLSVVF